MKLSFPLIISSLLLIVFLLIDYQQRFIDDKKASTAGQSLIQSLKTDTKTQTELNVEQIQQLFSWVKNETTTDNLKQPELTTTTNTKNEQTLAAQVATNPKQAIHNQWLLTLMGIFMLEEPYAVVVFEDLKNNQRNYHKLSIQQQAHGFTLTKLNAWAISLQQQQHTIDLTLFARNETQ